eukprot:9471244-Pyramimonas_sp.AAC.1
MNAFFHRRVAFEMGCEIGSIVGYNVRFEDRSSAATKIKYLTDGCLMRECLEDETLSKYAVIVLDEAHERSLDTDILFGLTKQVTTMYSCRNVSGFRGFPPAKRTKNGLCCVRASTSPWQKSSLAIIRIKFSGFVYNVPLYPYNTITGIDRAFDSSKYGNTELLPAGPFVRS